MTRELGIIPTEGKTNEKCKYLTSGLVLVGVSARYVSKFYYLCRKNFLTMEDEDKNRVKDTICKVANR